MQIPIRPWLAMVACIGVILAIFNILLYGALRDTIRDLDAAHQTITDLQSENLTLEYTVAQLQKERTELSKTIQGLQEEVSHLKKESTAKGQLIQAKEQQIQQLKVSRSKPMASRSQGRSLRTFTATAYTKHCAGCRGFTATGIDIRNSTPKIIAVDPNVIPLGTVVEILVNGSSWGMYKAADTGGAIKGHKIDILMANRSAALDFGVQSIQLKY